MTSPVITDHLELLKEVQRLLKRDRPGEALGLLNRSLPKEEVTVRLPSIGDTINFSWMNKRRSGVVTNVNTNDVFVKVWDDCGKVERTIWLYPDEIIWK